jgi:PKHD-type hydroxylase
MAVTHPVDDPITEARRPAENLWRQQTLNARTLPGVLTPDECEAVKQAALSAGFSRSKVSTRKGHKESRKRTSDEAVLQRSPETEWLFERIGAIAEQENAEHWRFAITGMEKLLVLRYRPMQRFRWHYDAAPGRKLTCVINLDAPGSHWRGKLELNGGHHDPALVHLQGAATLFPSYLLHRASAPWWGERWSLVTWFTGPPLM